jgi:hypothetical protein
MKAGSKKTEKVKTPEVPIVIQPVTAPEVVTEPVVTPEAPAEIRLEPVVEKQPELSESIDSLASIVDQGAQTGEIKNKKNGMSLYIWLTLAFLTGFGLGVGVGYLVWGRGPVSVSPKTTSIEMAVSPTVAVMTTPAVSVSVTPAMADKSTLKLQVLNGNGGKGVAAKAKSVLTEAGYKDISADNADTQDYKMTVISIKTSKNGFLEVLKKDLSAKYSLDPKVEVLPESSQFDAVITIGVK